MLLDRAMREDLILAIVRHIGPDPSFEVVADLVGSREVAARIRPGVVVGQRAAWILDSVLAQPTPDLLVRLVRTVDPGQALPDCHDLADLLEKDPGQWMPGSHGAILWAPQNWPFIDREHIRDVFATMAGGGGPCALVVQADLGHGKRTLTSYIDGLAATTGEFVVAHLNPLQHRPGQALEELVANLEVSCGLDLGFGFELSPECERSAQSIATRLADELLGHPSPVWLVVNLWSFELLQDEVAAFLDEILRRLTASPELARSLRVVLLTTDVAGLPLDHLPSSGDRFILPTIGESQVSVWLSQVAPGHTQERYDGSTRWIFDNLSRRQPGPENRLRTLSLICQKASTRLLQPTGGTTP